MTLLMIQKWKQQKLTSYILDKWHIAPNIPKLIGHFMTLKKKTVGMAGRKNYKIYHLQRACLQ
jgi:hypothetical protein